MLTITAILLAIGLVIYGWHRNDLRRLTRDFASQLPFDGALEECLVRFSLDDASTDCVLGANNEGLYMSSSTAALENNRRWSFRYYVLRTPLFIPWNRLDIRDARFPLRGHLRFTVPSNKAIFFVPREIGQRLLKEVGRSM
jgi:hypothetical protein